MSFKEIQQLTYDVVDEITHVVVKEKLTSVYFLRAALLIFCFTSLVFFALPESTHNRYANVAATLAGLVLCVLAYRRSWYIPILHLTGLLIVVLTVYASAYAGGINAIVLIWLAILPLMALIVGGPKLGIFWFFVVQFVLFGVWLATHMAAIDSTVPKGNGLIYGVMLSWLLCLISPFLVVWLYDLLQIKRSALLQKENERLALAQQKLRKTQAHKDEFIAAIGHELRTPMGAILGLNTLLQDQLNNHAEELEAAGHIRTSTLQLLDLINNILDFSQLQAGHMKMRPAAVNVVESLQSVLNKHHELAESKTIELSLQTQALEPVQFLIDPQRFEQVASNLIKNGLQHARSRVWVTAHHHTSNTGPHLTIEVYDDGPGPTQDQQAYLFNQFMGNSPNNPCPQGAGLGLTICKLLTELQQGDIGLKHQPNESTCFWFSWPAPSVKVQLDLAQPAAVLQNASLHILLVDDYPINLKINAFIVSQAFPNATVHSLSSGSEAQAYLLENPCDVVLIDFLMPGVSGFELAQWVRTQDKPLNKIIMLGLTASSLQQEWDLGLQSGMSGVLTKPLDKELLTKTVHQLLHSPSAHHGPTNP